MGLSIGSGGRGGAGVARVGDDALVVEATLAGGRATWRTRRIADVFSAEGATSTGEPVRAATLVWPTPRLWRRDVELTGQSLEELREAVGANLSAFFPAPSGTRVLWDAVALRQRAGEPARACVIAARADEVEGEIERLAKAGVEVTRVTASAECFALLLGGEGTVEERGEWGVMAHSFIGLGWAGSARGAAGAGAQVCDWRAEAPEGGLGPTGEWTAEHAALGGALAGARLAGVDRERFSPPASDLLGRRKARRRSMPTWARVAGVAALLAIGLSMLAASWRDRALAERDALEEAMREARPRGEDVDRMRATTLGVVAAHDRLQSLEEGYTARWRVLASLTEAMPMNAWIERVEILDDALTIDVAAASVAEVVRAIEDHPAFEQSRQIGGETLGAARGAAKARIEARITRSFFTPEEATSARGRAGGEGRS